MQTSCLISRQINISQYPLALESYKWRSVLQYVCSHYLKVLVRIPWRCVTGCPFWVSQSHLTCLGMNTYPLLASYSGRSDFSRPWSFSPSTGPKSTPTSKHSLASLDANQKRAIRLIDDPTLTASLDSLGHRRSLSALSLFYRYYHGMCSDDLKSVILPKPALSVAHDLPTTNIP